MMTCPTCNDKKVVPLASITGDPKSKGVAACPECSPTHFTAKETATGGDG